MRYIKILNSKYEILKHGDDIFITDHKHDRILLNLILQDLEDKILDFTNNLESKLEDMSITINGKCSELLNKVHRMPGKEEVDNSLVCNAIEELAGIKTLLFNNLDTIFEYIDSSIKEELDNEIDFLKFSSYVAKDCGEMKEAIKIQELTRKRIRQLSDMVFELCRNYENKIQTQLTSILDLINHKYDVFKYLEEDEDDYDYEDIDEEDIDKELSDDKCAKDSTRIPRTTLELKRHLKNEGFELHRQHGSHQIYKNKEGEVRLIPARRGNHVLAAKTAKKAYSGVAISN